MLREKLFSPMVRKEIESEWRTREISRIEGFSDAVFGFAVTLLVVALEVPRTSGELLEAMRGFGGFLLTFGILYSIWYKQFLFFRKFGLEDRTTVVLNGLLLVVVLFFVYPLKFLLGYMVNRLLGGSRVVTLPGGHVVPAIEPGHYPILFMIYGLGFAAVFCVFALLYLHAYKKRDELKLSPLEAYDTLDSLRTYLWMAVVGTVIGITNALSFAISAVRSDKGQIAVAVVQLAAAAQLLRSRSTRRKRRDKFLEEQSRAVPESAN